MVGRCLPLFQHSGLNDKHHVEMDSEVEFSEGGGSRTQGWNLGSGVTQGDAVGAGDW